MLGLFGMLAGLSAALHWWNEAQLAGAFLAIDGDSLRYDGETLRLEGIDAPELDQTCERDGGIWACGREARAELARLVSAGDVTCRWRRRDLYGRPLVRCTGKAGDLGTAMVATGLAVAYGDYADAETQARADRRGLWASRFERPQDWRAAHPRRDP